MTDASSPTSSVAATDPTIAAACLGCGAAVDARYCPLCGQETAAAVPTVRAMLLDAFAFVVDVDRRVMRTAAALARRPGSFSAEWLRGPRGRFITPVRTCLLAGLLAFAAVELVGGETRGLLFGSATGLLGNMFGDYSLYFVLVFTVPYWAAVLKAFRPGRRYYEHLVLTMHVQAVFFVLIAAEAVAIRMLGESATRTGLDMIPGALATIYLILAVKDFYGTTLLRTFLTLAGLTAALFGLVVLASAAMQARSLLH